MTLVFYVNALEGKKAYYQATQYINKHFVKDYVIPYKVPYRIVPLTEDLMTREFLLDVLSKQEESKGIEVLGKKGLFELNSRVFKVLEDRGVDKATIQEWKAMIINNRKDSTLLSMNDVINYLLKHPNFIRSYFVYDDKLDTYATSHASQLCGMAARRHTYSIRKSMRKEEMMHLCLSITSDSDEANEAWEIEEEY